MENQPLLLAYWYKLPSEIQQEILFKLTIKDLVNFNSCNRLMLEKINNNHSLWRTLYRRRAGANHEDGDLKIPDETSEWKILFQDLYKKAHLWTCSLCHGFPIDGYAYKCMHCEDFTCCHTCYEKYSHFENHVVLKYYNRLGNKKLYYRLKNRHTHHIVTPKCAKCQLDLDYPTNRSATDPQLYLCDTCLKDSEFAHHKIYRVVKPEVLFRGESKSLGFQCTGCKNYHNVKCDTADWPHLCVTCRTHNNQAEYCKTCYSSSAVMDKHRGHNVILRPLDNMHTRRCDNCSWSMSYGLCYRCSVCPRYDLCEKCELQAQAQEGHTHPMMIIRQGTQHRHLKGGVNLSSLSSSDSTSDSCSCSDSDFDTDSDSEPASTDEID